jgi:hypothetical protein
MTRFAPVAFVVSIKQSIECIYNADGKSGATNNRCQRRKSVGQDGAEHATCDSNKKCSLPNLFATRFHFKPYAMQGEETGSNSASDAHSFKSSAIRKIEHSQVNRASDYEKIYEVDKVKAVREYLR